MELWFLNAMGMIGFWWQGSEWQKSQSSTQNSLTPRDLQHCLVDHAFPRTKIVREFIKVLLYLYKQKALSLMNISLASVIKLKSHSLSSNSQTWASSPTESHWVLEEKACYTVKNLHCQKCISLPTFSKSTSDYLLEWLCIGEGEIIRLCRDYGTVGLNWQ